MEDPNKIPGLPEEEAIKPQPEIIVNDYGTTKDSAVVVEEEDRTVLLTKDETIVIEKEPHIDIAPKNRPRKINKGMWGQVEIATVGVALLAVLTTILLYIFLIIPAEKELEANRAKRDELERQMVAARSKYGSITSTEARVAEILQSVEDFENLHLFNSTVGKTSLYQRINGLISAYGLVNTTGPDYEPLEIDSPQNVEKLEAQTGKDKFRSIFPGEYITMTVEGSYQNLRRFIREIETSPQFVVISAVELEPSEAKDKERQTTVQQASMPNQAPVMNQPQMMQPQGIPGNPNPGMMNNPNFQQQMPQQQGVQTRPTPARGKTHGETVSLRLELAAYFRRPGAALPETTNQ